MGHKGHALISTTPPHARFPRRMLLFFYDVARGSGVGSCRRRVAFRPKEASAAFPGTKRRPNEQRALQRGVRTKKSGVAQREAQREAQWWRRGWRRGFEPLAHGVAQVLRTPGARGGAGVAQV